MSLLDALRNWARALWQELNTLRVALHHPATPWQARALIALAVAYVLSPVDLIPDVIPVLGWLDEWIFLPLLILWIQRMMPIDLWEECHAIAARQKMAARPNWWMGGLILALWVVALGSGLWAMGWLDGC